MGEILKCVFPIRLAGNGEIWPRDRWSLHWGTSRPDCAKHWSVSLQRLCWICLGRGAPTQRFPLDPLQVNYSKRNTRDSNWFGFVLQIVCSVYRVLLCWKQWLKMQACLCFCRDPHQWGGEEAPPAAPAPPSAPAAPADPAAPTRCHCSSFPGVSTPSSLGDWTPLTELTCSLCN